jgi:hypothetical protein
MRKITIIYEKGVVLLFVCLVYLVPASYGQPNHILSHKKIKNLNDVLPSVVQKLNYWPTVEAYKKKQIYNERTLGVKVPLKNSKIWTKDILSSTWQPPYKTKKLIIHNEAGCYDTIRKKWKNEGFEVQLTQTYTLFMLKLVKLNGESFGSSKGERLTNISKLASLIFASSYFIRNNQGNKVPLTISQLLNKNFSSKDIKYIDNGNIIYHIAKTVEFTSLKGQNYGMVRSLPWYEMINWFNKKNMVCFYFLKSEGGASPQGINFESRYNSTQFEIPSRFAIKIACKEADKLKIKYNREKIKTLDGADKWKIVLNSGIKGETAIDVNKTSGEILKVKRQN